jgi:hypothetical protein
MITLRIVSRNYLSVGYIIDNRHSHIRAKISAIRVESFSLKLRKTRHTDDTSLDRIWRRPSASTIYFVAANAE